MRLTDPQMLILKNASQRPDGGVEIPDRFKGGPAHKILSSLIAKLLLKPVSRRGALPLWRIGPKGEELALTITAKGRRALHRDDSGSQGDQSGGPSSRRADKTVSTSASSAASSAASSTNSSGARSTRQKPKTDAIIALLSRRDGATIQAIAAQLAWQEHSVRAFLSATLKKHLGLNVVSRKANGVRTYWIEA